MKKLFDLQLFADAAGDSAGNADNAADETNKKADNGSNDKAANTEARTEKKYSEEEVDRLFARKFAEMEAKREKKVKEENEARKLAEMNEQQRTKYELDQLRNELNDYKSREAKTAMANQARAMLQEKNINVSDELLANLVSKDAESTKASVESFISLFNAAVDKAVKEAYKGETPKKGGTSGLTAEQILKVENRAERQRLINENLHLFK